MLFRSHALGRAEQRGGREKVGEAQREDDGLAEGSDDRVQPADVLRADSVSETKQGSGVRVKAGAPEKVTWISSGWITSDAICPAEA